MYYKSAISMINNRRGVGGEDDRTFYFQDKSGCVGTGATPTAGSIADKDAVVAVVAAFPQPPEMKEIRVHKAILAARSPVFAAMLQHPDTTESKTVGDLSISKLPIWEKLLV